MSDVGRRVTDRMNPFSWLGADTPWWARVLLFILFWLGPSAVFAAVSVAVFIGIIPSPITVNTEHLVFIRQLLVTSLAQMDNRVGEMHNRDEQLIRISLATCQNVAKDDAARMRCADYWRR